MRRRIVLVGASGVFGARLAALIACWPDVTLVLAARRVKPLEILRAHLIASGARAGIEVAQLDRNDTAGLAGLSAFAVVDAAGPFQGSTYDFPRAVIAVGAHYVDLADGRDFVAGFAEALASAVRDGALAAVTGASSTPAISTAALDRLTHGWARIDRVATAIAPGARAPRGRAVVRAILSWCGQPVRCFIGGRWTTRPGWDLPKRLRMPGVGVRWISLAETPDLDALVARFHPTQEAVFRAGLSPPVMQFGLWILSGLVRIGLLTSLIPAAGLLRVAARLVTPFGSDRGGMTAEADGLGPDGEPRHARWALWAAPGAGPSVPAAPAAAILRGLLDGRLNGPFAGPCVGLADIDAILDQLKGLPIETRTDIAAPARRGMFPRLLGPAFDTLPQPVRNAHAGDADVCMRGLGSAWGSRGLAGAIRAVLGLPAPGRHPVEVEITPHGGGEIWRRRFGRRRFSSVVTPADDDPGAFDESLGVITFRFRSTVTRHGFRWRAESWRLGPIPLPMRLAPRIRALTYASDGGYRFSVLVLHRCTGVLFAYAGRLN